MTDPRIDTETLTNLLREAERRGFEKASAKLHKPRKGIDKKQIERIVMGQIKHTLNEHPEFFTEIGKNRLSSISKRIAGDVNAYVSNISASAKRANGETKGS